MPPVRPLPQPPPPFLFGRLTRCSFDCWKRRYTRGSWRRKLGSGDKSTRSVASPQDCAAWVPLRRHPVVELTTYLDPLLPPSSYWDLARNALVSVSVTPPQALVLLEYLVKNGSERVVDDARSHVSTVKMLRNFHYIDEKGKDQGINGASSLRRLDFARTCDRDADLPFVAPSSVRNRAKEIVELLSDVEKIRVERRKAKANRSKYTGVGNDGQSFGSSSGGFSGGSGGFSGGALSGASFQTQQGSRYGGFGSDSLAAAGGDGGGDTYSRSSSGGGGGGASGSRDQRSTRPDDFEEYDAGDDEELGGATKAPARAKVSVAAKGREEQKKSAPPVKAVDLFDFGDDDVVAGASHPSLASKSHRPCLLNFPSFGLATAPPVQPAAAAAPSLDDDFDDFQSAPSFVPPAKAAPAPPAQKANDLFDFFDSAPSSTTTAPPAPAAAAAPTSFQPSTYGAKPNYASTPSYSNPAAAAAPVAPASKPAGGFGGFDDLWSSSLGSLGKPAAGGAAKSAGNSTGGKSLVQIEQEKRRESLWGGAQAGGQSQGQAQSGGKDDFLL